MKASQFSLARAYDFYTYSSPVGVLTRGETAVFNCVVVLFFSVFIYWALVILPSWVLRFIEASYYYLTGKSLSIGVVASIYLSKKLHLVGAPARIPQPQLNVTRFTKEKSSLL